MYGTLEDHVKEAICPLCKTKNSEKDWKANFLGEKKYLTISCNNCKYEIYYEDPVITDGRP